MNPKLEDLKAEFLQYLRQGAKPRKSWRVGLEAEFFGFDATTRQRLDNKQIQAVLRGLAQINSELIFENESLIETRTTNGGRWTVEPGGQIEFSTAACGNLHEINNDLQTAFVDLQRIGSELGFIFLALGFDPLRTIDEQRWFLKSRYKLMKPYLQTRGRRAWDMMTRTCSVQVNLDYEDEKDLTKKFVVGNRLAPAMAAIFANSPFADGRISGFKSTRVATWLETDANRCGVSPLALQKEFSLQDFIEYALGVPMLFARRGDGYTSDFTGKPFREFLIGGNFAPTVEDWQTHLTTIFTEVRLKNYLEFRAPDGGDLEHSLAIAALWKGLLYDSASLEKAFAFAPRLTAQEFVDLQQQIAINGLQAVSGGVNVLNLTREIFQTAFEGLARSAPDEIKFLDVLRQRVLNEEKTPADLLLENWNNSIEEIFKMTEVRA